MAMNPMQILKIKGLWDGFTKRHPKFPVFLKALTQGTITEGSIIEITVTTVEGKVLNSNLKVTREDMDIVEELRKMGQEEKIVFRFP